MSMQKGMFPHKDLLGVEPVADNPSGKKGFELLKELSDVALSTDLETVESEKLCPHGLGFYCGQEDTVCKLYRQWASEQGANLGLVEKPEQVVEALIRHRGRIDFVMVDVDSLGDVGAAIDLCIYIRNCSPEVTIILVSSEVAADDFTAERMMACDSTLRSPISSMRMREAIRKGKENNKRYQEWRQDLAREAVSH